MHMINQQCRDVNRNPNRTQDAFAPVYTEVGLNTSPNEIDAAFGLNNLNIEQVLERQAARQAQEARRENNRIDQILQRRRDDNAGLRRR